MDQETELIHATTIAVGGQAAVIRGPSGCGKSDLALRCLSVPRPWFVRGDIALISDDQTQLSIDGSGVIARAPARIAGKLEIRGLGIVKIAQVREDARVVLVCDNANPGNIARLPEPDEHTYLLGQPVGLLRLVLTEPSAPVKLLLALARAVEKCERLGDAKH